MPDQVPEEVKRERFARMIEVQSAISRENNERLVGRRVEALVEGRSKTDPARLTARTGGNKLVHFTGPDDLTGQRITLEILSADTYSLFGKTV